MEQFKKGDILITKNKRPLKPRFFEKSPEILVVDRITDDGFVYFEGISTEPFSAYLFELPTNPYFRIGDIVETVSGQKISIPYGCLIPNPLVVHAFWQKKDTWMVCFDGITYLEFDSTLFKLCPQPKFPMPNIHVSPHIPPGTAIMSTGVGGGNVIFKETSIQWNMKNVIGFYNYVIHMSDGVMPTVDKLSYLYKEYVCDLEVKDFVKSGKPSVPAPPAIGYRLFASKKSGNSTTSIEIEATPETIVAEIAKMFGQLGDNLEILLTQHKPD